MSSPRRRFREPHRDAVTDVADAWRVSLGLGHAGLCRLLGRSQQEWHHMLCGRLGASPTFTRALLAAMTAAAVDADAASWTARVEQAIHTDALRRVLGPARP